MSQEFIDLLKNTRLFSQFSNSECQSVIKMSKTRDFASGSTIVQEGDEGGVGFYLILDGEVEVRKRDKVLATLGKGEFFGEMALLLEKDTPRSADVVAIRDTKCLLLSRWDLRGLIKAHPDMAIKMMAALAQRLNDTHKALSD